MIPHGVEVFVGLDPIDLRWSFDRLAGAVAERIGLEALLAGIDVERRARSRARRPLH